MPARTTANQEQRAFFASFSHVDVALGAKSPSDVWSVNLHGKAILWDKDWAEQVSTDKVETLLAIEIDGVGAGNRSEPPAHLHVNWREVRWVRLEEQNLPLIMTDRAIVFYSEQDKPRLFALYCKAEALPKEFVLGSWVPL